MKRLSLLISLTVIASVLAACATPTPEVVKEVVKETVIVAGTPQIIEKVVTKVVEKVVTATPVPTKAGPTGTIVVGNSLDPGTLDPRSMGGNLAWTEVAYIIDRLFEYDVQEGAFYGTLAESWERVDPLTWQFKLRKGVKFHNGEPFNAESVKYSIDSILDPEKAYVNASWIRAVEQVEIIDDYTVNIVTNVPSRSFLTNLNWIYMLPPKAAQELGDDFATNPIGTGPFKFVRYVANEELVLEVNEDYWGEMPKVKNLIFKALPEDATRLAALETGEVAVVPNVPPDAIARLEDIEDLEMIIAEPRRIVHLAFVWGRPPFDNPTLRKAFNYAVDRQALVDTIMMGLSAVADRHYFHENTLGFNENLEPYTYDPDKVKALLAEAGYPDGITVKFGCPHGRYLRDKMICEAIVGQFEKAGITSEFETREWGSFWDKAITGKEYDLYLLSWGWGADPFSFFNWWFDSRNSPSGYNNERLDELSAKSQEVMDDEEAKAIYEEIQEILWEDMPWVPLYFQPKIYAKNKKLKDVVIQDPIPMIDIRQAYMTE